MTTANLYGLPTYDDGTKWGDSGSTGGMLLWALEVDWDEDGIFDGVNESPWVISIDSFRGKKKSISSNGNGFEPSSVGTLNITVNNTDGRYNGWNTSSPLYPFIATDKTVRLRVKDQVTENVYDVFYGSIVAIETNNNEVPKTATIAVEDGWRLLRDQQVSSSLQTNIFLNLAIRNVLTSAKWTEAINLSSTSDFIPFWWIGNANAGSEIENICNSFLGSFFISASGAAFFYSRSKPIIVKAAIEQTNISKDVEINQPFESIRNIVEVNSFPRKVLGVTDIFKNEGKPLAIQPGETQIVKVIYSYNSEKGIPAKNVVVPLALTDFAINTLDDGSGTDLTASCAIVYNDYGDSGLYSITNNSAFVGYPWLLKVRGEPVVSTDQSAMTYPSDISTIRRPKKFSLTLPWLQDINLAKDFAAVLGPFFTLERKYPIVKFENRPSEQFNLELYDVISLTIEDQGIDGESYRIMGIEHTSNGIQTCQAITTTLYLEPYISVASAWRWDTFSVFDTSTVFGY